MSGARTIDVAEVLGREQISRLQITAGVLLLAAGVLDGLDNTVVAYAAPSIAQQWGLKMSAFAPVFSGGLLGTVLGTVAIGQLGDKLGRKPMLIAAASLFGLTTLLVPFFPGVLALTVLRTLMGFGIGGLLPNLAAMSSEYAPERLRAAAIMLATAGIALGAFLGGLVAAYVIPAFGWHVLFFAIAGLSLLCVVALALWLPESIRFLVVRAGDQEAARQILARIAPSRNIQPDDVLIVREARVPSVSPEHLFTEQRAPITLLLWVVSVMAFLVIYVLLFWLPALTREAGLALPAALLASSLFSLGGVVGSVAMGPIAIRFGNHSALAGSFVLTAVAVAGLAYSGNRTSLVMATTFLAGCAALGAVAGATALFAECYPSAIRSTGVGWAVGVGRFGSMLGPWIIGLVLARHWIARDIFLLPVAPSLLAALVVVWIASLRLGRRRAELVSDAGAAS